MSPRRFSRPLGVHAWQVLEELRFEQVLDLREADRFVRGHIPGALLVPYREVQVRAAGLVDHSRPVLLVDPGGARAAEMAVFLRNLGIEASYLEGGLARWPGPWETGP